MTVANETSRSGPYIGNGVTAVFNYDFRILSASHLLVIQKTGSGEETLMLDSDYSVSGVGSAVGGQVTLAAPLPSGDTLTLLLAVPFTQEIDLENQGPYFAETVEGALDLAVMRDLQLKEEVARAVKIPPSADPETLPGLMDDISRLSDKLETLDAVADNLETIEAVADNIEGITAAAGAVGAVTLLVNEATVQAGAAAASANSAAASAESAAQQVANVTPTVVQFSGDGVETEFDLGVGTVPENLTTVFVAGLYQRKSTYSIVAGVLTFAAAPPVGTNNIEVVISGSVALLVPSPGIYGDMFKSTYDADNNGVVDYITNAIAQAQGVEGGQINLEKSATSTLSGSIAIDSNGQRLRFFEQGVTTRGAFIDLSKCAGGANSELYHAALFSAVILDFLDSATVIDARTALALAAVASTGAYADLSGRPTLGTAAPKNLTVSTADPSGGNDGDIWIKVAP